MAVDYEREGRIRKAAKLGEALALRGVSVEEAAIYAPAERNALARSIGVRNPSDETWEYVLADLRLRRLMGDVGEPLDRVL